MQHISKFEAAADGADDDSIENSQSRGNPLIDSELVGVTMKRNEVKDQTTDSDDSLPRQQHTDREASRDSYREQMKNAFEARFKPKTEDADSLEFRL